MALHGGVVHILVWPGLFGQREQANDSKYDDEEEHGDQYKFHAIVAVLVTSVYPLFVHTVCVRFPWEHA